MFPPLLSFGLDSRGKKNATSVCGRQTKWKFSDFTPSDLTKKNKTHSARSAELIPEKQTFPAIYPSRKSRANGASVSHG